MCHHKADLSAIAFAQLQLFNKPFPICKCSNHSCIAVSEAISGCFKCQTEVHLEKHKITLHFSWNLPAEQCLPLLLPLPACPFQQQSSQPALLPSCPLAQNTAQLMLGALCLSAAQDSCGHQVMRNQTLFLPPFAPFSFKDAGDMWVCCDCVAFPAQGSHSASQYVSMPSVLQSEHQLLTPAMGNTPFSDTHTHIHFIVLRFFNC